MGNGQKGRTRSAYAVGAAVLALILWELTGRLHIASPMVVPVPSGIAGASTSLLSSREFYQNWFSTLTIWALALTIGLAVGLVLGLSSGASTTVYATLSPLLGYMRAIPPIVLFPVALVALGPGCLPIGVVATLGAAVYVFPGTAQAAREASQRYSPLARIMGYSRLQFLRHFVAPGAAFHALAAVRVAATYSFAACVGGEMIIGGRLGVGAAILDLSERYQLEEAYLYVLLAGFVGILIDFGSGRLSKRWAVAVIAPTRQ